MATRTNPITFLQPVRTEAGKVVWPSRRETIITTIMVFVFTIMASLFFFLADQILGLVVGYVLGLGS